MLDALLFAFWFFVPAGLANAAPVLASRLPRLRQLEYPMDFGRSFRGKRIFGPHKTFRGLLAGVIIATIVVVMQQILFQRSGLVQELAGNVNYAQNNFWLLGPLLGAGALMGDAVKSFFKRQVNVPPGRSWFPFDQLDYIIGGLLFASIIVKLDWYLYLAIIITWFGMHLVSVFVFYKLGIRDHPI